MKILNVSVDELVPTEEIIPTHLQSVLKGIGKNSESWPPIIITENSYILDGHHRYHLALTHSIKRLPAYYISYSDPRILVFDYNDGTPLDKITLLKIYKTGILLKPKTTRHVIEI